MERYKVKIKGVTALLMNKWCNELQEIKQDKIEYAKKRLYTNDKGEPVIPAEWIERALMIVAREEQVKGFKKLKYSSILPGNLIIEPRYIVFEHNGMKVDERTVVIPSTGGRVIRYRPRFDEWKATFEITILDERITQEILQKLLIEAGRRIGIGDGRTIGFGRFILEEFKKL